MSGPKLSIIKRFHCTCKDRVANQFASYNNSHMSIFWYLPMYSYIIRRVNLKIPDQLVKYYHCHVHMYTLATKKINEHHVEYNGWEELTKLTLKPEAKIKCEHWTCSCKQKPFGSDVYSAVQWKWEGLGANCMQCSAVGGARSQRVNGSRST